MPCCARAPAKSERKRRRQVRDAVTVVSRELANTPTICLNSYVHKSIVTAFEEGALVKASEELKAQGLAMLARAPAGKGDLQRRDLTCLRSTRWRGPCAAA